MGVKKVGGIALIDAERVKGGTLGELDDPAPGAPGGSTAGSRFMTRMIS